MRSYQRGALLFFFFLLLALIPLAAITIRGATTIARFDPARSERAALVYDVHDNLLATLGDGTGRHIRFADMPAHLVDAVVAIEDTRFWRHRGIDLIGIGRALLANLRSGRRVQGASTVTQQLARNLFLSHEKTYARKIQEAIYALLLEMRFSKQEIMELYLNRVYFGAGAYGIGQAALTYFDKSPAELTLAESALLIGLLQAPNRLSPFHNVEAARNRRNLVLARMNALGYISPEEAEAASQQPVTLADRRGGIAPYFVDYVHQWLIDLLGSERVFYGDLRVYTTLDPQVQEAAEQALGEHQGAIVALDPRSGAITAMVGGRSYTESQFNRATQAVRQPGSAFKPFVYAAALERGWQLNDLVEDIPRSYGDYAPRNFRDEYWGTVTLKHAMVESLNNGSVWLLQQIGPAAAVEMARRLGITTLTSADRNLALALGGLTRGTTPLEMAAAYGAFANGGIYHPPHAVREVRDGSGRLLYRHRSGGRRALSPEVAYFITDMLEDAVQRGTGTAAYIGRAQAGKTGTSNDQTSAWFVGYTPTLVAAVYIGEDEPSPLPGGGGTLAAPIWGRFARQALRDTPNIPFARPANVVDGITVDIFTGLLADEGCPYREVSSFVRGREPVEFAPCSWGAPPPPRWGTPFANEQGSPPSPAEAPPPGGGEAAPRLETGVDEPEPSPYLSLPGPYIPY